MAPTPRWREKLNRAARRRGLDILGWTILRKKHIYSVYEQLYVDEEGLNEMYLDEADEELLLASLRPGSAASSFGGGYRNSRTGSFTFEGQLAGDGSTYNVED